MIAILDDGDVDIDNIAAFQLFIAGDTMTYLLIDGCTDGFGVTPVIERRRDSLLDINDIVMTDAIQLFGADADHDMRGYHLQHFSSQPAGRAHFYNFIRIFYYNTTHYSS